MNLTRRDFLKVGTLFAFPVLSFGQSTDLKINIPSFNTMVNISKSVDLSRLLRCIAEVETGNNDSKIGRNGERSRYQIKKNVWYQHCPYIYTNNDAGQAGHETYCKGKLATQVAMDHLIWLNSNIPHDLFSERLFRQYPLAACWNGGLSVWRGRLPTSVANYATRVTNLYDDKTFHPASL